MKKVTTYFALDGTQFESVQECLYHEALINLTITLLDAEEFDYLLDSIEEYLSDHARMLWPALKAIADNDPEATPF